MWWVENRRRFFSAITCLRLGTFSMYFALCASLGFSCKIGCWGLLGAPKGEEPARKTRTSGLREGSSGAKSAEGGYRARSAGALHGCVQLQSSALRRAGGVLPMHGRERDATRRVARGASRLSLASLSHDARVLLVHQHHECCRLWCVGALGGKTALGLGCLAISSRSERAPFVPSVTPERIAVSLIWLLKDQRPI
jgi:hypothetical protein